MRRTTCPDNSAGPPCSASTAGVFFKPGYLLFIVGSAVFGGELMTMLFLSHLPALTPFQEGVVDSMLLTVVVFPVLYHFVFRPMRTHIDRRRLAEREKDALIGELQQALSEVKTLRGIIPICSSCKSVRDDKGYWKAVEEYIGSHADVVFSHGVCPECARKLYADYL